MVSHPRSEFIDDANPSRAELVTRLAAHHIKVIGGATPDAPVPRKAILAVTGGYVQPTVRIRHSRTDRFDAVDRHWQEQAKRLHLKTERNDFLLLLSNPGSEERGWLHVQDELSERLASRVHSATGRREFIALSLDGRKLCAVSVEDDEDWIVTHTFS